MNSFSVREERELQKIREIIEKPRCEAAQQAIAGDVELLADAILKSTKAHQARGELSESRFLSRIIDHPDIKSALLSITDLTFRAKGVVRTRDLLLERKQTFRKLEKISFLWKWLLHCFLFFIEFLPWIAIPCLRRAIRSKMKNIIFEEKGEKFFRFVSTARSDGYIIHANRLGEAILGNEEAEKRIKTYIEDLKNPLIHGISIKLSSLFCHLSSLDFQREILPKMREKFVTLLEVAQKVEHHPLITIDMEEFRDLFITQEFLCDVASLPSFQDVRIGVAIQAYIPDSSRVVEAIIEASKKRVKSGGVPLYVRLVKGANLLMEQIEAEVRCWPQAPFLTKQQTDSHYLSLMKRLFSAAREGYITVGIATHNIFDMAYALIFASCAGVSDKVWYEMLSGIAPALARTMKNVSKQRLVLYCPVADPDEIVATLAYLMRRLDENSQKEHFLPVLAKELSGRHGGWHDEGVRFQKALLEPAELKKQRCPYVLSERLDVIERLHDGPFANSPDIDWSIPQNRKNGERIRDEWMAKGAFDIPLVVNGKSLFVSDITERHDPSRPSQVITRSSCADEKFMNSCCQMLSSAQLERKSKGWFWSVDERVFFLKTLAKKLEEQRCTLIGAMLQEISKPIPEADGEVSEAVDFCCYYAHLLLKEPGFCSWREHADLALVASPWNFPLSLSLQHILQGVLSGHAVLYKPSLESVHVGFLLFQTILAAGLDPMLLHFVPMNDVPVGLSVVRSPYIDTLFLTGSTETGRLFLKESSARRVLAETGGKNVAYLSATADIDIAVRDIVHSAFSYSGQKCSALSVLLVDRELFSKPAFLHQLGDAAASLIVESAWNLTAQVVPLAKRPSEKFLRAVHNLETHEQWLLPPSISHVNPHLYSPSIKLADVPGTYSHVNELFGPMLLLLPTYDVRDALRIAHMTQFGLTSGIYSLSDREICLWKQQIDAGLCYVNRPMVGALVGRQPFGGWKASSFGIGMKVGGPFALRQIMACDVQERALLGREETMDGPVLSFVATLLFEESEQKERCQFCSSFARRAYTIWKREFDNEQRSLSDIHGQENIWNVLPREELFLYVQETDSFNAVWAVVVMAAIASTKLVLNHDCLKVLGAVADEQLLTSAMKRLRWQICGTQKEMVDVMKKRAYPRLKTLQKIPDVFKHMVSEYVYMIDQDPPCFHPSVDFLSFVREKVVSRDTHRYGHLQ